MTKTPIRLDLKGAKELDQALAQLGPEIAEKVGAAATRAGGKALREALYERAPYNPKGPTLKVYTAKSGMVRRTDYGHLRDNLRVRREKATRPNVIRYVVTIGRAFWGFFLEHGTVRMAARPWARPTFDGAHQAMLTAIMDTLRTGTARAAKRLARRNARAGIGHNGGPAVED